MRCRLHAVLSAYLRRTGHLTEDALFTAVLVFSSFSSPHHPSLPPSGLEPCEIGNRRLVFLPFALQVYPPIQEVYSCLQKQKHFEYADTQSGVVGM